MCEWYPQDRWCSEEDGVFKMKGMLWGRDFRYVGPALPVDQSNDRLIGDFLPSHSEYSIWDYHGGCFVGKVVDRNFRLIVIDAPRVLDGSIFTLSPGTNPQSRLFFWCLDSKCFFLSKCLSLAGLMTVRGVDNFLLCFGSVKIVRERMR